jgi:hypothetical protein
VPGELYRYLDSQDTTVAVSVGDGPARNLDPGRSGYISLSRLWKKGDVVHLSIPMPVRRIVASDSVAADRGRVALERGPLVYCSEWVDQPGGRVLSLVLPDSVLLRTFERNDLFGGIRAIAAPVFDARMKGGKVELSPASLTAIPYYAWAHRGQGEMTVWLPRTVDGAEPEGGSPMASQAVAGSGRGLPTRGVNNGTDPLNSLDTSGGMWRTRVSDTSWVQYDFASPQEVSAVDVYWFDNGGSCTTPSAWRVMLRYDGKWVAAYTPEKKGGVEKDRYNRVVFEAFKTDAIRLEVVPRTGASAGVLEWKVY